MLFLERNSTVRTPKLYAAFMSSEADPWADVRPQLEGEEPRTFYYIVQEFIEGTTVDDLLGDHKKFFPFSILSKMGTLIGEELRKLRSIQPKDNKYGRINGRPFLHIPTIWRPEIAEFDNWGPFTYDEFVSRVMHSSKVRYIYASDGPYESLAKLMFRDAKFVFLDNAGPSDRTAVLSHLDLQMQNVMVKMKYDDEGRATDVENLVIIDWEFMAWTPPWFEPGGLWAQGQYRHANAQVVAKEAIGAMGQVNTAIVSFWGGGITQLYFK